MAKAEKEVKLGKSTTTKGDKDGSDKKSNPDTTEAIEKREEVAVELGEEFQEETPKKTEAKVTKAGKRSPKAIAEAEAEQKRQEKKAEKANEDESAAPKVIQTPARPRIERASKKMQAAAKLVDRTKSYSLTEGLELAVKTSTVKFDATVELHINLGVDPRQADQNVRGTVVLPAGTGKSVRIAVLVADDDASAAKKAGADIAGEETLLAQIEKGQLDFDILISTPALMAKLGKHARVLGPKGLMPNPKSGTVTTDIEKAVREAKAGKVEFRVDPTGIIHVGIGKVSFGADKLQTNAEAIIASIRSAKPASLKGNYVKSLFVTTTMGPSIRLSYGESV